jgi:hypothetical protein
VKNPVISANAGRCQQWERATERPEYAVAIGDQAELCFKFTELKRSFAASGNLPDNNRRAQNWTRAPE